jgi:hypothetical protein
MKICDRIYKLGRVLVCTWYHRMTPIALIWYKGQLSLKKNSVSPQMRTVSCARSAAETKRRKRRSVLAGCHRRGAFDRKVQVLPIQKNMTTSLHLKSTASGSFNRSSGTRLTPDRLVAFDLIARVLFTSSVPGQEARVFNIWLSNNAKTLREPS